MKAPVDKIERRAVSSLMPYAKNPRLHSPEQVGLIAASMREHGQTQLIVVDEAGEIIAGHGRILAAEEIGLKNVMVGVAVGWTEAQKRAYRIKDNQLALSSTWDDTLLSSEIATLQVAEYDLNLLGFDDTELASITDSNSGMVSAEATPEPSSNPVVRVGEVWLLGRHRLLCGDATNEKDHNRVIGKEQIDAVLTDPPYGVGVDYRTFEDSRENVEQLVAKFMPLITRWPVVALTSGHRVMWSYPRPTWILVWVHPAGMGSGPWGFNQSHPILVYGDDPYLKARLGSRPDSVVMAVDREGVDGHPTPKPVKVWEWLLNRVTIEAGQAVFDPFVGSGTTIIAAEMTARCCYAIEIDPAYVQVCIERWQTFTGKEATLEGDGRTFNEIKGERSGKA